MHFQTDRIKAKTLISFSILMLAFTGCTSVEYQQMQNERDTRREVYEDARRKEVFKRSRDVLSDDMLGRWEFLELVVEESGGSEDILKAKAALAATKLKGFRLRFWRSSGSYYYRVENLIAKPYGTYTTGTVYKGEEPLYKSGEPRSGRLRFYPISGSHISDLIFGFTKGVHKQVFFGDGEVRTTQIATKSMEVSMEAPQLDLVLDLGMVLSPDGWLRRGNIRCSFQRIE
ncbi:hypothetical protein F4054_01015 [Candidatus Poribacteria bacterium]|nr:hypothetical protein [Candidatus Poribacteria bacterium]MYG07715.1 hypothetical protein [Candidatus Poribacteria bacterium]MYK20821.1 hypothetical protein [Candidatus Poribacteria bacterium]